MTPPGGVAAFERSPTSVKNTRQPPLASGSLAATRGCKPVIMKSECY